MKLRWEQQAEFGMRTILTSALTPPYCSPTFWYYKNRTTT